MYIASSHHKWRTRWQSLHTQHGLSVHICLTSPLNNVLIQYSLTVWFDHTFLPKHLWGSLSAFCNYPQRCNLGDLFLPFALSPRLFPIGQTFVTPKLMSSSNTPWLCGLTTLSFKTSLGIIFCLLQLFPKMQSWGSISAFCTIPKIFTNW